jgi:hypothetical protein
VASYYRTLHNVTVKIMLKEEAVRPANQEVLTFRRTILLAVPNASALARLHGVHHPTCSGQRFHLERIPGQHLR